MTATTTGKSAQTPTIADALRAILAEVTSGNRPYSGDSYLPDHLIEQAQAALDNERNSGTHPAQAAHPAQHKSLTADRVAIELHQLSHNALASAAWHVARGEATQALSRIKRAQAHLAHSLEGGRG